MLGQNACRNMETIRNEARAIRAWCLDNRHRFSKRGFDIDLLGMCAIASARLFDRLVKLGYTPIIAISESGNSGAHVFVVVDDHIIDVTASQFGMREVEIIHTKMAHQWFWQIYYECDSVIALAKHQQRLNWVSHQIAIPEKVFYEKFNYQGFI